MLTLILFRHSKAEAATPGMTDIDRGLAPRGRTDAPLLGAAIVREALIPDLIVCSTSRRTRETLALAAAAFPAAVETHMEAAIYEASPARLLSVIRRTPAGVSRLMLVGHNPGFEDLARDLIHTADKDADARMGKKFPTSGLAVLTFKHGDWAKLTPRSGHLALFTAPRYLT